MTTSTTTPRVAYTADGSTTSYTFNFEIADSSSIAVYEGSTKKTLTTHYTISFDSGTSGTGSVVFVSAPSAATVITFVRDTNLARTTDFTQSGAFLADTINNELDRLSQAVIDATDKIENRAISTAEPNTDTATTTMPAAATRANKSLTFDSSGNVQASTLTDGTVTSVGLTTSGDDLTITSTPVTTSGNIGIALANPISVNVTGNLTGNVTGNVTTDGLTIADADIKGTRSNENIVIDPAGSGKIQVTSDIDLNGQKITGGSTSAPSADGDLTNKKYVDDNLAVISTTQISQGNSSVAVADSGTGTITTTVDGNTEMTVTDAGVVMYGNLEVKGTTTTINTTNTSIEDPILELSRNNSGPSDIDAGIMINRGAANNAAIYWNEGDDVFKAVTTTSAATATGITDTAFADFQVKDLTATSITATTSIANDAISINDNKITTTRSNDHLYIDTAGGGDLILQGGDDVVIQPTDDFHLVSTGSTETNFYNNAGSKVQWHGNYASTWEIIKAEDGVDQYNGTGTNALPDTGDNLWEVNVYGGINSSTSSKGQGAQFVVEASNDWTGSSYGTQFYIKLAKHGSTSLSEVFSINGSGDTYITESCIINGSGTEATGLTVTGASVLEGVTIDDNTITTNASNANLEISASGTGTIELQANTNVTGDLTTSAISLVDNKISANRTNDNLELSAIGDGNIIVHDTILSATTSFGLGSSSQPFGAIHALASYFRATSTNSALIIQNNDTGSYVNYIELYKNVIKNTTAATPDIYITPHTAGSAIIHDVSIRHNTITTNASNANLEINANGTGTVVLENLSVAGDGATVTGILDEDAMGSNSAVKLATQQSIKAYVDANVGGSTGDLTFVGSTISSPSNADLTLTTSGTGDIVLDALRINGTTLDSSDSSKITIAEALDVTGAVTITSGTITGITDLAVADGGTGASSLTDNAVLTGTGTSAITAEGNLSFDGSTLAVQGNITATTNIENDAIRIVDHTILGLRSNDNIVIDPAGTGSVAMDKVAITGGTITGITDITVADGGTGASTLTDGGVLLGSGTGAITAMAVLSDGEMIVGDGSTDPVAESGATLRTSIGVGTGDSPEFTGLTISGSSALDGVTITDNAISTNASNADLQISANGTGRVMLSSNGTFTNDLTSNFANSFGSTDRNKGTNITYKETISSALTSSSERRHGHLIAQDFTLASSINSSDSDNRFRAITVGCVLDLNGATVSSTSAYAGPMGGQSQAAVTNTNGSTAGTLGNMNGAMVGAYAYPPQDLTVTNAVGQLTYVEADSGGGGTPTFTNGYAHKVQVTAVGSAGITNGYAVYIDNNDATNKYSFWDSTAKISRFGTVILANVSDPSGVTDSSHIFAKDDSGSSEVHVRDEAGNITKISPHNEKGEWEFYSKNNVTGKTFRVNMEKLVAEVEKLSGKKFIENI